MIELTPLTSGMTNYVDVHNANYAAVRAAINVLESVAGVSGGDSSVSPGLEEIFDRAGIIGKASYKPPAGVLTGPNYYLVVAAGAYWDSALFYSKSTTTSISMTSKTTGTYYIVLNTAGTPLVQNYTTSGKTLWQFSYDSSTHTVSNVTLYSGVAILFDGDDYADMLTSAVLGVSYESVAERLEAIEGNAGGFTTYMAEDSANHSGLDFAYKAGIVVNDNGATIVMTAVAAGTVTLTDNTTNYVEINTADGVVSKNTTAFQTGRTPLFEVVTLAGAITTVSDKRTWAFAGGSGGGGGHAQNTDTGTDATEFVLNRLEAGTPSVNCGLAVERGTSQNTKLRWNETLDTWELTRNGVSYEEILTVTSAALAGQEFTKYEGKTDPDLVHEEFARGLSLAYENIDLSTYVTAPVGISGVVLGVRFWDSTPGSSVNVKFATPASGDIPAVAYTVWSNEDGVCVITVPPDSVPSVDFFVTSSGAATANLQVFLLGYMKNVIGIGTTARETTQAGIAVPAASFVTTNITGAANRALAHYLKITETGGLMTGTYDVIIYDSDAQTNIIYHAVNLNPGAVYEDFDPWWMVDADVTSEIHVKIINNDAAAAGTFTIETHYEQFA